MRNVASLPQRVDDLDHGTYHKGRKDCPLTGSFESLHQDQRQDSRDQDERPTNKLFHGARTNRCYLVSSRMTEILTCWGSKNSGRHSAKSAGISQGSEKFSPWYDYHARVRSATTWVSCGLEIGCCPAALLCRHFAARHWDGLVP